ncbi:DsbA family protein [Lysinibacillus fusiformis]|uniref:DsbA family protein n=1 Tax=Lysinibacillus fusiformis TaxID=28031 RepID=UPI000E32F4A5|nr:DsbA family protein [Lysinibacillus fusiformis]AXQ50898.1 DsbA family protein [Stenotrophomonas rhizophila]KAB0447231.1 dihydroneopterin aldolase [Lysinibacillus fusiformis]
MKKNSGAKFAVILTLMIFVAVALIVVLNNKDDEPISETSSKTPPSIEGQPIFGETDAPVTIVEFGDFKCPACKAWGDTVFPKLVKDYIESGDVNFAYVNVPFHGQESVLAALAAESVYEQDPSVYWEFHKILFSSQPETAKHDELWVTIEKLLELTSNMPSISPEKLTLDLEQELTMPKVEKDTALYKKHGVGVTPTIIIKDKKISDPFDYEEIKKILDAELSAVNE